MMTIGTPAHHHPTLRPQRHPHRTSSPTTARRARCNLNSPDYTSNTFSSSSSFLSLPSATSTTLSQRLRRSIIHDDLPTAQRIAAQATLLAQTPHSRHLPRDIRGPIGRQWMKQRHILRTYGEECLVPQGQASIIDGLKKSRGSLKFDIRNVDRISESKEQNSPLYASSIRYSPLAGEKVPRPCYPLDCTIPEQDATKTSVHLAIEYQCGLDLIEWILKSGHETGEHYQSVEYSFHDGRVRERGNFLPTRDRYGRTIFHLATIFNRCDVLELYHSHLSELLDSLSHPHQEAESQRSQQDSPPDRLSETRSISSVSADSHSSAYVGRLEQVDNHDERNFRMTLSRSSQHQQIDSIHDGNEPQQQDGEEVLIDKHRKSNDSLALSLESISTQDDDDEAKNTILSLVRATDGLSGATALHEACSRGLEDAGRILLSLGASIDATDACGNTPLHYASSNGHPACVQLLIEKGAIFGLRNHAGFSPADVAFTDADRATLEALGRDSLVQKKEKRKEERLARVVLAAERANLGRAVSDATITDENDKIQAPAVVSCTANGGSGGATASPGRPESSPLPPFARPTSALSIRKYPWYLDEGEGFQNLPSPALISPRSRLASFSRMTSRNSTLISSPVSPTLPPPPSLSLADGRESSVLRMARRSSSALRSWAIGYGRATSPALGSHSPLAGAAAATLDASATEPTTPTFPYASSVSSGSPALHLQRGDGSIVSTTHTATAVSSPASTTVLPSPKLLPRSGLSTTPLPRFSSNSPTSHPFRLLTTTRSTTSLASSFLRPNRPSPGARPRSIDIDSLRIGFNFLSGTGMGSSTSTVGEGGGARVHGANAAGASARVGNGLGSPDDSGTEELTTPTTPYDRDGLGRYFSPSGVGGGAYIPSSSSISLSSNSNQQSQLLVHRHQQQQAQQPHQQRNFSGEAMHARPRGGSVGPSHTGGSQGATGWGDILGDTAGPSPLLGAPSMVRKRSNSAQINSPSASPSLMMVYSPNVSQAISSPRKEESASLSCRPLRHIQHGIDLGEEGFGSTSVTLGSVGSMSSTISSTSSLTLTGRDHSFGSINTASTSRHEQNQGGGHPSPQGSTYHDDDHGADDYDHIEGGYAAPFNTPREEEEEEREICLPMGDSFTLPTSMSPQGDDIHRAYNMRTQDKTSFEDQNRVSRQGLDADVRGLQKKAEVNIYDQYTTRPTDGYDQLPMPNKLGTQKYPLPLPLPLPRRSSRRIKASGAGDVQAGQTFTTSTSTSTSTIPSVNSFTASTSSSSSPRGLVGCSEEDKQGWAVKDPHPTHQSEESLNTCSNSIHSSTMHLKRGPGGPVGGGGPPTPHPPNLNHSSNSNSNSNSTSTSISKEAAEIDSDSNSHPSTSTSMGTSTMMMMMITSPSPPVRPPRRRP